MTATLMRVAGVLYQWARPAAASVLANAEAAAKAMHSSFHLRGWKREGAYHAAGAFAHTVVWACAHVGACMRLTAGWVEGPARDEVPQNPAVARVHDRGRAAKEVCVHAAPARAR